MMPSIRLACLAALLLPAAAGAEEVPVWFGTYTRGPSGSEGIYVARFDTLRGTFSTPVLAAGAKNPSFLAFHPRLPMLYAVAEVAGAEGKPEGGVAAFAVNEAAGTLTAKGEQSSGGAGPCHVTVDPSGSAVLAANYGGGSLICLGLATDGTLEPVATGTPGGFIQHAYDRAGTPGLYEVLVEGAARKDASELFGRTECNRAVVFKGPARLIGHMVPVTITEASQRGLRGAVAVSELAA